jgi:hypothetical protein
MTLPTLPYEDFLKKKLILSDNHGVEIPLDMISNVLKPDQRDAVQWCIRGGRRAFFGKFGRGKTLMQLEIARQIIGLTGKPFLIGLPLGVKPWFYKDAEKLGVKVQYVHDQDEVTAWGAIHGPCIFISNYERIREGKFTPAAFGGVSFDEASVVRSMGTKTAQYILSHFRDVKFRFVFTATPSPNEYHELLKYADFLGIMDIGQALNRYFKRNSAKAHASSLLAHREEDFWLWVSSWALFTEKPSDFNPAYSDEGYNMPEMKIHWKEVKVKDLNQYHIDEDGNPVMFGKGEKDFSAKARHKRESIDARIKEMNKILRAPENKKDHFIIWHHLEDERRAIEAALPKVRSVYGSQKIEVKEQTLLDFADGKFKYLATKPEIAGSGANFQYHCHKAIFLGIDYDFNDFIQAIHRIYRYHQQFPVEIWIIYTDKQYHMLKALKAKWHRHDVMVAKQVDLVRKNGLNRLNVNVDKRRTYMTNRQAIQGRNFTAINNDNVLELRNMAGNSVDLQFSSIPFSDEFEYCESYNDMGQSNGDREFFAHLDYSTPHKFRVLKPGRMCVVHVKDTLEFSYQNGLGFITVNEFSDKVVAHYKKHGYAYCGRITITTDVVFENKQSNRLGWSEMCKDGTKMGAGMSEYLLIFRKPPSDTSNAYADEPVTHSKLEYTRGRWQLTAHDYWRSNGNRYLTPEELRSFPLKRIMDHWKEFNLHSIYDFEEHVKACEGVRKLPTSFMAMPPISTQDNVWTDIVRIKTLNTSQRLKKRIMHVCPLQIDVCDRVIERWSNPGDLVMDEFSGIFTVANRAIVKGRRAIGIELSTSYWKDGVNYLQAIEYNQNLPTLFDMVDIRDTPQSQREAFFDHGAYSTPKEKSA